MIALAKEDNALKKEDKELKKQLIESFESSEKQFNETMNQFSHTMAKTMSKGFCMMQGMFQQHQRWPNQYHQEQPCQ